jgi:hypothetical protein
MKRISFYFSELIFAGESGALSGSVNDTRVRPVAFADRTPLNKSVE